MNCIINIKEVIKITTNERIKLLRTQILKNENDKKFSLRGFAEKIGVSYGVITNIENNLVVAKDNVIKLICLTFNVNEDWLRNGIEPIFKEGSKEDDILKTLKNTYQLNDTDLKFLENFFSLSSDQRQVLYKLFDLKE